MARFGQALKPSKAPQQLSKASAPHNPPLAFAIVPPHRPFKLFLLDFETATWHVLARPSFGKPQHRTTLRLLCHCFYWASKLLHGTFWPGLKTLKSPAAAFEKPQHRTTLRLLCHRTSPPLAIAQPSACFAIVPPQSEVQTVSIGLRNCYMARFGQALAPLAIAQPSACFAIAPPHRPFKLFLLGFETATWHVLARP